MGDEADFRFKLILLGNIDVGKTSLIIRFTDGTFSIDNAGEIDQKSRDLKLDSKTVKLIITDTAGQERFRTLTSSYYRNADAIIVVYDVTDAESFTDVESHISEGSRYSQRSEKFLVGNKIDLDPNRVISTDQGKALADKHNIQFAETSAKEGTDVDKLFDAVAKRLVKTMAPDVSKPQSDRVKVDLTAPTKQAAKKSAGCSI